MNRRARLAKAAITLIGGLTAAVAGANAGEIGHYAPGALNVRDFFQPPPGFYASLYNIYYTTDTRNDRNGNKVNSVTINPGPGPGVTLQAEVDVDIYTIAPALVWSSPYQLAGVRYAALVMPTFGTPSIGASLSAQTGAGLTAENDSRFAAGDMFVQPVWLGLARKNWDFAFSYGFYAPVGAYEVKTVNFPQIGATVKSPSADNVGFGFWTHQLQGAVGFYPWEHRGTAVSLAMTYELHHQKEDIDVTPGSHLSLNWGVSQYLPLTADKSNLLEIGIAGYSQWQVTDDTGSAASNPSVHDQVHAAGLILGWTYVPYGLAITGRYSYEFASEDRFQGSFATLIIAKKI